MICLDGSDAKTRKAQPHTHVWGRCWSILLHRKAFKGLGRDFRWTLRASFASLALGMLFICPALRTRCFFSDGKSQNWSRIRCFCQADAVRRTDAYDTRPITQNPRSTPWVFKLGGKAVHTCLLKKCKRQDPDYYYYYYYYYY